jgi:hypothetical protein
MLSCFPPSVKAAHEAAVALLGCLYSLKPTASARALDGTAVVAAPEPVPLNLFGGADDESTAVATAPEPASLFDLLDGTDTLLEAEIEELNLFVLEAGDIVDGVVNRDKITANLEKLLWYSSGSRGDSYIIGVRDGGFDLGCRDKDSMETRTGVLSRDDCSTSESARVRVGLS